VASSTPSSTDLSAADGSRGSTGPDRPDDAIEVPAAVKMLVPGEHAMVSLLGTRDELLRVIEDAFAATVHVLGK
jgi:phosphate starvation-inducible protein PhoH and related proteins